MSVEIKKFQNPLEDSFDQAQEGSASTANTGAGDAPTETAKGSADGGDNAVMKIPGAFVHNFMGHSPGWYKAMIAGCLCLNPVLRIVGGRQVAAWAVLLEFVFTLFMTTECYPLQPGGLITIQGFVMGLATAEYVTLRRHCGLYAQPSHASNRPSAPVLLCLSRVELVLARFTCCRWLVCREKCSRFKHEVEDNINVILLISFMVACIHFLKALLLWVFTDLLVKVENKVLLSLSVSAGSLSLSLSLFLSSDRILDRRCLVDLVGVLRLCRWSLSAPSYPLFWTRFPSRPSSSPCAPVSWVCITTRSKMPTCRCWRLCIMRPCRTSSCR